MTISLIQNAIEAQPAIVSKKRKVVLEYLINHFCIIELLILPLSYTNIYKQAIKKEKPPKTLDNSIGG